jgi:RNA polymerase sigma factor (sigma-70 family)
MGWGTPMNDPLLRDVFLAHSTFVRSALARLGVPAADRDDVLADVFFRVYQALSSYDGARPMRSWLFGFTERAAFEYTRLARHRREVLGDPFDDACVLPDAAREGADEALEREEERDHVHEILGELDDEKRVVFTMNALDEIPIPEVARRLGIAEGTAYSRLRAARFMVAANLRRQRLVVPPALR